MTSGTGARAKAVTKMWPAYQDFYDMAASDRFAYSSRAASHDPRPDF
jgi:hypothetical protein